MRFVLADLGLSREQTAKTLLHSSIEDFEDKVEAAHRRQNSDLLQVGGATSRRLRIPIAEKFSVSFFVDQSPPACEGLETPEMQYLRQIAANIGNIAGYLSGEVN